MADAENPPPGEPPSDMRPVSITDEMKRCYLDYAMSVIVSRALPDVRDGLKPVHRRILYSMHEQRPHARQDIRQIGARGRRRDGQIPSARRQRDLRRAGAHGAGFLHAPAADRRAGQFRLGRRRSAGGDALHRVPARQARDGAARRHRQGHRRLPGRTTTATSTSRWSCRRASRTCWSTAPAASPSAWRPTSRRTISAR